MSKKKQYLMGVAEAVAKASKDNSSKVGCVITDHKDKIVSTGYNGFPAGCDESKLTYERPMKYFTIIHAEMNALLFARQDLTGCKMYTNFGPCENCLKHTLQAGIREIYYKDPGIMRDRSTAEQKEAIRRLIEATGAKVVNVDTNEEYIKEIGV